MSTFKWHQELLFSVHIIGCNFYLRFFRTAGLMTLSILRIRRPPKSNLPLGMDALCKIILPILIIIISSAAISYQRSRVNVDRYFKPQNLDIGVHDQIPCHQSKYLRLARSRTVWKQFLFGPAAVLNTKWCSVGSKFGQRVGGWVWVGPGGDGGWREVIKCGQLIPCSV